MSRKRHRGRKPRHTNLPHQNRIRVRGKRRDADETKLSLAYWLLAKQQIDSRTVSRLPTEGEVRSAADDLGGDDVAEPEASS